MALCLILIFPMLCYIGDLNIVPESYFSDKHNFFNQYFVKVAWGWTLGVLTPFIILAGCILWKDYPLLIVRDLSRLVVATLVWFVWVSMFNYIEYLTGSCSTAGYNGKKLCLQAGHNWDGFDISGHSFILMFSALVIHEELQAFWVVTNLSGSSAWFQSISAKAKQIFGVSSPANESMKKFAELMARLEPLLNIFAVIAVLIEVMWLFMLVWTSLYFHSAVDKILGGAIAIFNWLVTYRLWYRSTMSPGLPGKLV